MARVSSAELQRKFGTYSEIAQREPVTITNHGRDSLVLISINDYERLRSFDTRRAFYAREAPEEFVRALEVAKPPEWTKMYNHEVDED
jgi:prevent-host-death family protein